MNKTYKIASLFSGCGGLDLGFSGGFTFLNHSYDRLPTEIVFANDFDKDASACYNSNPLLTSHGAECLLEDIRNISSESIPDFDILLAGFPCQPFSNAGNRKGVNDEKGRGTLFEECERIIKHKVKEGKAPIAFVFENVRGILSSKMPDGTLVPNEIRKRMENLGYNVAIQLVRASDYGVPQNRYRVLIIGVINTKPQFDFSIMNSIVKDLQIPSVINGTHGELLLGSILRNIESLSDNEYWEYSKGTQATVDLIGSCEHGEKAIELFVEGVNPDNLPAIVCEGRSWKNIPPDKLSPRFKKIYDDPKKYHAPKFFRRFAYGEINGTITASAQPENCVVLLTQYIIADSLLGDSKNSVFSRQLPFLRNSLQSRYKVIGNAVPPILGWVIAKALLTHIQ